MPSACDPAIRMGTLAAPRERLGLPLMPPASRAKTLSFCESDWRRSQSPSTQSSASSTQSSSVSSTHSSASSTHSSSASSTHSSSASSTHSSSASSTQSSASSTHSSSASSTHSSSASSTKSSSPAPSTHSEASDRSPVALRPQTLSDSDSDVSSDSLPSERTPDYVWTPALRRAPKPLASTTRKPVLPESLLQELREKWEELHKKRLKTDGYNSQKNNGHSQWSNCSQGGRSHRRSLPASPTLSRASLTFPSSLSLCEEQPEGNNLNKNAPVNSMGKIGTEVALYECRDDSAGQGFAGIRDIFNPQVPATIRSGKGTVRGVKNRVRAGIATFTSDQRLNKHFLDRERGKVIVYVTTLGIVRTTYERCLRIRKILWTLLARFEERDVFMARDTQLQLLDRLRARTITVPHVFLEGQYLGDAEQIERLNECGELRRLLQPYKRQCVPSLCDTCGGFRLLPCTVCNGSKKSVHRNDFTLEFVALKCSSCDESGLVKCSDCDEYKEESEGEQE